MLGRGKRGVLNRTGPPSQQQATVGCHVRQKNSRDEKSPCRAGKGLKRGQLPISVDIPDERGAEEEEEKK